MYYVQMRPSIYLRTLLLNVVFIITEVQVLLLTDLLILMEKNEDKDKNKYHLRCHTLIDAVKEKDEVS